MAKAQKPTKLKKERAANYEPKVALNGTFEDMIGISIKDTEKKLKAKKGEKED